MKSFKKIISVILMTFLLVTLAACKKRGDNSKNSSTNNIDTAAEKKVTYPLTIKDSYDRTVVLNSEPQKVISIAPNITETIYAIGGEGKLIGRTDYCDYPEKVKDITSIGTLKSPNMEKIVELQPDLVIASTHFTEEAVAKLEELKIPVVVLYGSESFDGVYETISKVGQVLNLQEKSNAVVEGMKKKVSEVENKVKGKTASKVYYVVSSGKSGEYTSGGDTFIGNMIKMAGGQNIAEDLKGWKYSLEKIIENNPDIIICSKYYETKASIKASEGYKDLDAVKNDKLLEIDNNLLDRQGPRLAEGLEALAKLIHPEAFK